MKPLTVVEGEVSTQTLPLLRHPDPHIVTFFTMQRLMNLYFQTLLTSREQTVTMPYRASEAELTVCAGLMKETLESTAGIRPRVPLVKPV